MKSRLSKLKAKQNNFFQKLKKQNCKSKNWRHWLLKRLKDRSAKNKWKTSPKKPRRDSRKLRARCRSKSIRKWKPRMRLPNLRLRLRRPRRNIRRRRKTSSNKKRPSFLLREAFIASLDQLSSRSTSSRARTPSIISNTSISPRNPIRIITSPHSTAGNGIMLRKRDSKTRTSKKAKLCTKARRSWRHQRRAQSQQNRHPLLLSRFKRRWSSRWLLERASQQ